MGNTRLAAAADASDDLTDVADVRLGLLKLEDD
jgi:hypothetical protein